MSLAAPAAVTGPSEPSDADLQQEWLLTNGLGGFAMGGRGGENTRRYHGLLIGTVAPPTERLVALHSCPEQLTVDGQLHDLWSQWFGDPPLVHPAGRCVPCGFAVNPVAGSDHVTWWWQLGSAETGTVQCIKRVRLHRGENRVTVTYQIEHQRGGDVALTVRPLTPMRDFHQLSHADQPEPTVQSDPAGGLLVTHTGCTLRLRTTAGRWSQQPQWWYDFAYPHERLRGLPDREDLWSPGSWRFVAPTGSVTIAAMEAQLLEASDVTKAAPALDPPQRIAIDDAVAGGASVDERLDAAADQFIVARRGSGDSGISIIAGYPWFADWGRDSMISLPGLLLARGRFDEARSVLETFAAHLRDGLIPNRFDDAGGSPHYNTVDASLWFVHAARQLLEHDDRPDIGNLLDACRQIIHAYRCGTVHDIFMDDDGLIAAGGPDTQLTWMDAQRDGVTFTPRHGKAVEINALWYNALCSLEEMTVDRQEQAFLRELIDRSADSFRSAFWWTERGCCHDLIMPNDDGWTADAKLRPNQIFAVSLPNSPLHLDQQRDVVKVVGETLLTPYGLRTLAPDDPDYHGRYEGTLAERDAAYHQGTVWPWLIGPYAEALLKVEGAGAAAKVREVLQPLLDELDRGCVGQLAEVYDGDPPHRSSGCPAQAWSVAEVIRVKRSTLLTWL